MKRDADMLQTVQALDYEQRVYKNFIRPLVDQNICPNFVKFLGKGTNCDIMTLLDIVKTTVESKSLLPVVIRNIRYMLAYGHGGRPSITNTTSTTIPRTAANYNIMEGRFNLLMTEDCSIGYRGLNEFIQDYINFRYDTEFWQIIFQVVAGLYALSNIKMTHNDLHSGNVLVGDMPPQNIVYVYNGVRYQFVATHRAKIFDFDHSYIDIMGKNPFLYEDYCDTFSQCNEYIPNKDTVQIFGFLYKATKSRTNRKALLECLSSSPIIQDRLKGVYEAGIFLQEYEGIYLEKGLDHSVYSTITPPQELLDIVAQKCNISRNEVIPPTQDKNLIFVCNPSIFDEAGNVVIQGKHTEWSTAQKISELQATNKKSNFALQRCEARYKLDALNLRRVKSQEERKYNLEEGKSEEFGGFETPSDGFETPSEGEGFLR
jgi:hypothetical protein